MRFENLEIDNIDLGLGNGQSDGNFEVICTDELVDLTNKMRERDGNTDLVKFNLDNDT